MEAMTDRRNCSCVTVGKRPACEQNYCILCGVDTDAKHYCATCDAILLDAPKDPICATLAT